MLDKIAESVIRKDTTEQLNKAYEGIVEAMSFRSAQGMGTDQTLSEMLTETATEINAREIRR